MDEYLLSAKAKWLQQKKRKSNCEPLRVGIEKWFRTFTKMRKEQQERAAREVDTREVPGQKTHRTPGGGNQNAS